MKQNSMLKAAQEYARRGWRVFPILAFSSTGECECKSADCDNAGKHPATEHGFRDATTDAAQITKWWTERPDWGIGIATGSESGLTVLDVDGEEGVEELGRLAGPEGVPITPCSSSRPGHLHYYFLYKAGVKSSAKRIAPHLDTRGDKGYVVAPPSRHAATGGRYAWVSDPSRVELASWPEWMSAGGRRAGAAGRGRPARETFNTANPRDVAKLEAALAFVDADDEEKWAACGWIIGRAFAQSDAGFVIYSAWAGRSRKHNAKKTRGHYYEGSKLRESGAALRVSHIYEWAGEGGWVNPTGRGETKEFNIFEDVTESNTVRDFGLAAAASPEIYVQSTRLVHIVKYKTTGRRDEDIKRDAEAYIVVEHTPDTLAVKFGDIANYWVERRAGEVMSVKFSRPAVQTFMACREFGGIKPLVAFVTHPTIRADGTMIEELGYDAATGLFLTSEVEGLRVEGGMSRKASTAAMRDVLAPFSEYPWASGVDRSIFAAALLTVGLRHLFETAPLFGFSSPARGSGKSMLMDAISLLWYGVTASKTQWSASAEEREKRWSSFLLAGDRLIGIDNVPLGSPVDDATLNMALTSRSTKYRILGRTEKVELNNDATWMVTGNQLNIVGDLVRRSLVAYVDPRMANPGSRTFKIPDLLTHLTENRAVLLGGMLGVARSWINAHVDPVPGGREFGSFTAWYKMIRGILLWTGEEDIAKAINRGEEEDSEMEDLAHFANELMKVLPPERNKGMTQSQVLTLVETTPTLSKAVVGALPQASLVNRRTVSDLLRSLDRKVFVTENPGHEFRIIKWRDTAAERWIWGYEYMSK